MLALEPSRELRTLRRHYLLEEVLHSLAGDTDGGPHQSAEDLDRSGHATCLEIMPMM
jgi:hypothetical protein